MLRLFLALWLSAAPAFAGSMALLGAGKPTGGGAAISLTYTDNRFDGSASTTITYNNQGGDPSCGTADPNRIVVVAMGRRMGGINPTSVTIAGVSATEVSGAFNDGSGVMQSDIWYAAVPTGTTCSVVIAWDATGNSYSDSAIGVYRLITATPTPTASANATTNSGPTTLPAYTVPTNGVSLNFWSNRDGSAAISPFISWTNTSAATGDFYTQGGNGRGWSGSTVLVPGSVTVTADQILTATNIVSMSAAAWGP